MILSMIESQNSDDCDFPVTCSTNLYYVSFPDNQHCVQVFRTSRLFRNIVRITYLAVPTNFLHQLFFSVVNAVGYSLVSHFL